MWPSTVALEALVPLCFWTNVKIRKQKPGELWAEDREGLSLHGAAVLQCFFFPPLASVLGKAQAVSAMLSFLCVQAFQGELFHLTVLLSLTIAILQKHVPYFKFSLFFFPQMRHLVYFSPCLFSPLPMAASPAGAALLGARETFFFHFYCYLLIFSPLWAQNLLLLPNRALHVSDHPIYN